MNPAKITIFAPGLIGGSVALAATQAFPKTKIAICTRRPESIPAIRTILPQAEIGTSPSLASHADLVLLGSPPSALPELVRAILPFLSPTTLVTDVSSFKESVEKTIAPLLLGHARWIGSHPMAGSEQSGISAARAELFHQAPVILTPTSATSTDTLQQATSFWQALGARVLSMTPQLHDAQIARISHLPHLIATTLVLTAGSDSLPLAGSGYRDTTRIASGPAPLWTEILIGNQPELLASLKTFRTTLDRVTSALENKDASTLSKLLDQATQVRRALSSP
jgi:prephenate dehydrogenase